MRSLGVSCGHAALLMVLLLVGSAGASRAQDGDSTVTYEGHKAEFTIALPAGWSVYDQLAAMTGKPSPTGMLIFTSASPKGLAIEQQLEVMGKMDNGAVPSFFVDRAPAKKGTTCASFPEKAQKEVVRLVQGSFAGANVTPPSVDAATVGGCQGIRVRLDFRSKDGTEWLADVRAVSDGKTLYLFSLRNHKANFEKNVDAYEKAMSTLRLAAAP